MMEISVKSKMKWYWFWRPKYWKDRRQAKIAQLLLQHMAQELDFTETFGHAIKDELIYGTVVQTATEKLAEKLNSLPKPPKGE